MTEFFRIGFESDNIESKKVNKDYRIGYLVGSIVTLIITNLFWIISTLF